MPPELADMPGASGEVSAAAHALRTRYADIRAEYLHQRLEAFTGHVTEAREDLLG
jgi:hypothetical protein